MSLVYKSNNFHPTENGYRQDKYGWTYQSCKCCPYGYHIDLDFVRYCETIDKQGVRTDTMDKRRERRRQRQSMEVLLGLVITPDVWHENQHLPQIPQEPSSPKVQHLNNVNLQSTLVQDALGDVVSDFEKTLERSNNSHHLYNMNNINHHTSDIIRVPSTSSVSSSVSGCMAMFNGENVSNRNGGYDPMGFESTTGLSPKALKSIRERMALGLERMKELEEKVKVIPTLQVQISVLKEEKRKLVELLKERNSNTIGTDTVDILKKQSLIVPQISPKKDIAVMCTVITRHVGVGPNYPKMKTIATSTEALNKLIEEQLKSNLVTQSSQTKIIHFDEKNTQTIQVTKPVCNIGINVCPDKKDVGTEFTKEYNTIGISDDRIDTIICPKCSVTKRTIGIGPTNYADSHVPISLKSLISNRSKSFNLGEEKLNFNLRYRTIGCQTESFSVNKMCQYESKSLTQFSQTDINVLKNKSCQYEHHISTQMTDTSDLLKMRDASCNTKVIKTVDASSNTYKPPPEIITTPPHKTPEIKKDESPSISRIPRPATISSSDHENRKFKRQDTYTKLPVQIIPANGISLSGLDLSPTFAKTELVTTEPSTSTTVKQSLNLSLIQSTSTEQQAETTNIKNGDDKPIQQSSQPTTTKQETTMPLPEPSLYSLVDRSSREKILPSKEMRGAMKVLNDSLQKSKNSNVRSQVQKALDIIQQEWFKVSSTASANPLVVEDYLDCFEEISSTLLQFIVNMTDDSGNTAMHYAVSHANFDVVSILLDSKVCNINKVNKAGYTSVMLVSLTEIRSSTHTTVVKKLFQLADVNIRARQHGQTALMLAVSHGRLDMVQMLVEAGADVNIQDEDGSTALMCAAEHGHTEIVKFFLTQTDCDSSIVDVDGSSALKIALEAGHKDLGVILYTHEHSVRGTSPYSSQKQRSKSSKSSSNLPHASSRSLLENKSNK